MKNNSNLNYAQYQLLDSGHGEKLEKFGDQILVRPSTLCIWPKRYPEKWNEANAVFEPKVGWKLNRNASEEWDIALENCKLRLRLQKNGQIGFFPEHATYMHEVATILNERPLQKVLNLFAYTGLATLTALQFKAEVTHIDMLKLALDWAKTNIEISGLADSKFRLIPEEALTFVKREVKRGNKYDVIIADPPSFSRISKSKEWTLLDNLAEFINDLSQILLPHGTIFFTCHMTEAGPTIIENLMHEFFNSRINNIESRPLCVKEALTERKLPAGFLVKCNIK